jgi:hypothetical protein
MTVYFRQNSSKEAPINVSCREKEIGGRKITTFGEKVAKRDRKIFVQLFRGEYKYLFVFS